MEYGRLIDPLEFPGSDIAKVGIVALGLTVGVLVSLAEMAAAGFLAMQRISRQEFGELEEVGHAAGVLEVLIERLAAPGNFHVPPKLIAQLTHAFDCRLEPRFVARHAAALPHRPPQIAVNAVDR